jgi:hypothetical protein
MPQQKRKCTILYGLTDGHRFQRVAVDPRRRNRRETGRTTPIRCYGTIDADSIPFLTTTCAYIVRVKENARG